MNKKTRSKAKHMAAKKTSKQFAKFAQIKFIYFDNAASTPKPKCVLDAVMAYNKQTPTNEGRAGYQMQLQVSQQVQQVRERVADFVNATSANDVVFTKNTTEAIELVAQGFAKNLLKRGDEIVVSELEHHSNFLPWVRVAKQTGAKLVVLPLNSNHKITVANAKKVIGEKTKIVALAHASNVLGYMSPVKQIVGLAHKVGAYVLVDGAQSVSHTEVDIKNLKCDFFVYSGYKMFAPTGVGVLVANEALLQQTEPLLVGGGMVLDANPNKLQWKQVPYKFEAGTLPISAILGLGQAIDFLQEQDFAKIEAKETLLKNYLVQQLQTVKGITLYAPQNDLPIVAFNLQGVHAHDAATLYDEKGVALRAGHHCAQPLMQHLQVPATLRVSLAFYNTQAQIDKFVAITKQIVAFFNQ